VLAFENTLKLFLNCVKTRVFLSSCIQVHALVALNPNPGDTQVPVIVTFHSPPWSYLGKEARLGP